MAHEMLGRGEELAAGRRFLVAVGLGPACLVIEGPPGIGKSMLWHVIGEEAATAGMRLLTSRPSELEIDLPHVSLADLFGPVAIEVRPELPAAQRRALDVALLSGEDDADDADLRALGTAILTSLRRLATRAPVIVAVDDVQWADRATAGALSFAARRLRNERVGFLLARRPAALSPEAEALETAFANAWKEVCALEPMSLGGLHRLIDGRFGINLPRPSLVHLERATLGVPLFALDLVDALRRDGRPMTPDAIVPAPVEIERMVARRLDGLAEDTRRVVDAVAAVGRPHLALLEALEGNGVDAVLASAIELGLLEREPDRIRFAHPLYRSAVYRALPPDERRHLHLRVAEVVADRGTSALHLGMGTDGPDADVATRIGEEAAAAEQRGTAASAAVLYGRRGPDHADRCSRSACRPHAQPGEVALGAR